MQTILGSNGQIGQELAKALHQTYTKDIRLVSRKPIRVNATDELVSADLLKYEEANKAIAGSDIVYLTSGLPMDSELWEAQFPLMMANVIKACQMNQSKLVFFDNTYMYAKTAAIQDENSPFEPVGRKSAVRAQLAEMVLQAMATSDLQALICRAPEFYGPGKTQSITNTMIFNPIKNKKSIKVPVSASTLRTLIWTPDASRAMALLGNTESAYGQTWHLPCEDSLTYQEMIALAQSITGEKLEYSVIKLWQFKLGSYVNHNLKELQELLPRYQVDNHFGSDKFKAAFPEFTITPIDSGIRQILGEAD